MDKETHHPVEADTLRGQTDLTPKSEALLRLAFHSGVSQETRDAINNCLIAHNCPPEHSEPQGLTMVLQDIQERFLKVLDRNTDPTKVEPVTETDHE